MVESLVALHTGDVVILHAADGLLGQVLNYVGAAIEGNAVVVLEALGLVVTTLTIDEAILVGSPLGLNGERLTQTELLVSDDDVGEVTLDLLLVVVLQEQTKQGSVVFLQSAVVPVTVSILCREVGAIGSSGRANKGVLVIGDAIDNDGIANTDLKDNAIGQTITLSIFQLVTIFVLILVSVRRSRENQGPAALGLSYFREER